MRDFQTLLRDAAERHGHLCAGQVLGVRMALRGLNELGVDPDREPKRILAWVEIDRCATDAIATVTGCSLGRRTLKFLDYGKMAATFVDTQTQRAVRVVALESARERARAYAPPDMERHQAELVAYQNMPDEELMRVYEVRVAMSEFDLPGPPRRRVTCACCGEGVNDGREVIHHGETLCRACAENSGDSLMLRVPIGTALEEPVMTQNRTMLPLFSVVGKSGAGKTTLIVKLLNEFKARGIRVAIIKHHAHTTPIDAPHKDSARFTEAGAAAVLVASAVELAHFERPLRPLALAEIASRIEGVDLILAEGFRREPGPKIEVSRAERGTELISRADELIAVISDHAIQVNVPRFDLDDIHGLADFMCDQLAACGSASNPWMRVWQPSVPTPSLA